MVPVVPAPDPNSLGCVGVPWRPPWCEAAAAPRPILSWSPTRTPPPPQVDGMSKNFRRAGGLRIGWSVGPEDLTRAMVNLQSHYTSGPATPTQRAALAAIA